MNGPADMETSPPLLSAHELDVELGGQRVLNRISFAANGGEFIVILGPNGAGKTTLLRALDALIETEGSVALGGAAVRLMAARTRARQMSYLPQGGTMRWPMTVREIVSLGRLPYGDSSLAGGRAAIDRALADCDLLNLESRNVMELSGGERARVALARTLAVGAPVILADEPTTFLDPAHQIGIMRLLSGEIARGRLVIAVLHDVGLALRYATRILGLAQGRMVVDTTPDRFVAGDYLHQLYGVRYEMAVMSSGQLTPVAEV